MDISYSQTIFLVNTLLKGFLLLDLIFNALFLGLFVNAPSLPCLQVKALLSNSRLDKLHYFPERHDEGHCFSARLAKGHRFLAFIVCAPLKTLIMTILEVMPRTLVTL